MSQSTFDEDDLFDEAAEEMHQAVEAALDQAREEIPDADALIESDADNLIGALNAVSSTVSSVDIEGELEEAKKQFAIGRRADAFDDEFVERVEADLITLQEAVESLQSVEESATELTDAVTGFQDLAVDEIGEEISEESDTESGGSSEAEDEADSNQQQLE